ncbi:hypothetical protein, partial [Streptomyces clavuligerus]|uniref:hypothetical protein n=5 Tax=Streptomyces clavuligerus TaxID=1901 RepID=UPI001E634E9B
MTVHPFLGGDLQVSNLARHGAASQGESGGARVHSPGTAAAPSRPTPMFVRVGRQQASPCRPRTPGWANQISPAPRTCLLYT